MKLVDLHTVIADVLSEHNELIPVLNRFGIRLGVGDKTLEVLCEENNLDPGLIITVLNVYLNDDYVPDMLEYIETESIADYFQHTVENYIHDLMPNIEKHLYAFIALSSSANDSDNNHTYYKNVSGNEELAMLRQLFTKFKEGMTNYLKKIANYDEDFPDELLHDLKNILIKHLSTEYNQNLCYAVIFSIHSFEKDLEAHNRLREKVLQPKLNQLDTSGIRQLQHSIVNEHTHKSDEDGHHLTNRETEILRLIVQGNLNKEIADMLNISLNTVLTHRKNIINKTGIKTVSGLTFYCLRNGLISM
ncbi:MAG: LuxR C-terminal-related transcriptional regulator [Fermentimonas sp.]|nr:LuxR C-terminal-related transcriptional regulator [Fermentimonas sp.]